MTTDPETGTPGYPAFTYDPAEEAYRLSGEIPPWRRKYRDGVDVTDQPELWPDLAKPPKRPRRRR